ncbi:hypothetical protein B0H10DRAFT_1952020 [Mycena sp. CBHHK59/15]|nr:hypothetical protein B0H10DRAFT_1952020 [Mycena sp. CBHHK59/15]
MANHGQQSRNSEAFTSFPTEILTQIFLENKLPDRYQSPPQEVAISHVSRRFREVAINTPRLWTTVRTRPVRDLISIEYLDLYLRRSEPCLITVVPSPWRSTDELEAHSALIILHIHRLRELIVRTICRPFMAAALALFRDVSAPRLERLEIIDEWDDHDAPTTRMEYFDIFTLGSPSLHSLHLQTLSTHLYVPNSRASVTTLELSQTFSIGKTDLHEVLTGFPNLTHLQICNELIDRFRTEGRIFLPSVRSFTTQIEKGWASPAIWPLLDMPHVEKVILHGLSNKPVTKFPAKSSSAYTSVLSSSEVAYLVGIAPFCVGECLQRK